MIRLAKTLIAGTAILMLPLTPAFADGSTSTSSTSNIINGQINLNTVWSNANISVDGVNGDVASQSVGVGNALEAVTMNDTTVNNNQYSASNAIGADQNANVSNVNGSVTLVTQTACNQADVSTDPNYTNVHSQQECAALDPSQATNASVSSIVGDVSIAGSAVGNTYTEDTNATTNALSVSQLNKASINSTTNANVSNVGGTVNVSSTAIGNNAQIVHY